MAAGFGFHSLTLQRMRPDLLRRLSRLVVPNKSRGSHMLKPYRYPRFYSYRDSDPEIYDKNCSPSCVLTIPVLIPVLGLSRPPVNLPRSHALPLALCALCAHCRAPCRHRHVSGIRLGPIQLGEPWYSSPRDHN